MVLDIVSGSSEPEVPDSVPEAEKESIPSILSQLLLSSMIYIMPKIMLA